MRGGSARPIALLALFVLLGCAAGCSDGGVGGTGIASTVRGNVLTSTPRGPGERPPVLQGGGGAVAGIEVRERGSGLSVQTDAGGAFELHGALPVESTIEFVRSGDPTPLELPLFVSRGSEVTLQDVLLTDIVEVGEIRTDLPPGPIVEDAICDGGMPRFLLDQEELRFTVFLDEETVILGGRTCSELIAGTSVKVRGIQAGMEIRATEINISKSDPPV